MIKNALSRRTGGFVLTGAAVAMVLAGATVPADAAPAGTPSGALAATQVHGMRYHPHWLPPRAVELVRSAVGQSTTRTWIDGDIDGDGTPVVSGTVSVSVQPGHLPADGTPVRVDGKPGKERTVGIDVQVSWEPEQGVLATVAASVWPDDAQVAERVANSVRADDDARFEPQLSFGQLPTGWADAGAKVFGDDAIPATTHVSARTTYQGHDYVITVGPLPTGRNGLVLGSKDGQLISFGATPEHPEGTTHVPGWPDFTGVLAAVHVNQHADVSWIGTR